MDIKPSEKSIYKELRVNMWQYFHYSELAGDALNEDSESTSCHVCVCVDRHTHPHTQWMRSGHQLWGSFVQKRLGAGHWCHREAVGAASCREHGRLCSEGCFCVRRAEPPQPRGKEAEGSRESAVDSSLGLSLAPPAPLYAGPSVSPRWHDTSLIPSMLCGFPGLSVLWFQSLWHVFKVLRMEGWTDFSQLVVLFPEARGSPWSGPRWRRVGLDLLVCWSLGGAHSQGLWDKGTIAWGPDASTSLVKPCKRKNSDPKMDFLCSVAVVSKLF